MDDALAAESHEVAPRGRNTFASLSLPQFRYLLAGTAVSQVASWMEEVARGWLVLQLTDSPLQLGLIGFIRRQFAANIGGGRSVAFVPSAPSPLRIQ